MSNDFQMSVNHEPIVLPTDTFEAYAYGRPSQLSGDQHSQDVLVMWDGGRLHQPTKAAILLPAGSRLHQQCLAFPDDVMFNTPPEIHFAVPHVLYTTFAIAPGMGGPPVVQHVIHVEEDEAFIPNEHGVLTRRG